MKFSRPLSLHSPASSSAFPERNRRRLTRSPFAAWLVVFGSALALQGKAFSVDQTWQQANSNNEWSLTAPNWDGALPWTNDNNAIFGDTGETVELSGNLSV